MQPFRAWINEMWYQHLDELASYGQPVPGTYSSGEYFQRYKWWLKREYQYRQKREL